jgi:hypothetical protein
MLQNVQDIRPHQRFTAIGEVGYEVQLFRFIQQIVYFTGTHLDRMIRLTPNTADFTAAITLGRHSVR